MPLLRMPGLFLRTGLSDLCYGPVFSVNDSSHTVIDVSSVFHLDESEGALEHVLVCPAKPAVPPVSILAACLDEI